MFKIFCFKTVDHCVAAYVIWYVGCFNICDVNGGNGSGRDANKNVCANSDPYDTHIATDRTENYVTANARLVNI